MEKKYSFLKKLIPLIFLFFTVTSFSQQYRYIRIQKSGTNTTNYINLSEIQVIDIDGVTNRSLAGTATLSSIYSAQGVASHGNDGNTNGNWANNSVLHSTNTNPNEWWEIDLGALYSLSKINIYNRTDCCFDRLSNMYVMASDTPFNTSGSNGANLITALANSDFTYQFGVVSTNAMQVVTFPYYFSPYVITTPGTSTFTVPSCVSSVTIQAWGGGASGNVRSDKESGGGGGGGYVTNTYSVVPGQTIAILVGAGGVNAANGGDSSYNFNATGDVIARGGTVNTNDRKDGGLGGAIIGSYGAGSIKGGNGGNGNNNKGGGGGGSGPSATNASGQTGGTPGGGKGGDKDQSGANGNAPGGGGGGRGDKGADTGSGANGQVIISWTLGTPPIITGTTPNSRCGTGTVVLTATASAGTINWYAGATGGSSLGTGTSFATPSISVTTTYYVDATIASCTTATRTAITATVNPLLTTSVSISANPSLIVCDGTSVTYTATPTNGGNSPSYQWKVNGTNVGTNSPTYTYIPLNGDIVSAVLISSDACAAGLLTQPILNFSWDDNTKAITDSNYGINAISGTGQYVAGSLAPIITPKTDINLTFDGTATEFNSEGIDYSLSYSRNEGDSQLFTRGNSLIIKGGSNFSVSYRVSDGAGSFTTVTSGNFPIVPDGFHVYRFRYDPSDGFGRLYVDGTQVWISPAATPGKPIYWTGAGNVVVGNITDASGTGKPTFDNLLMSAVYIKSAAAQVTMTVNAAPATPGVITGTATQFPALTGETYSIAAVPNATTYNWTVPIGWAITAGAGTTAITVTTGNVGDNGNITVSAENTCGTSVESTLAVTVIASKIDFDGIDDYVDFGDNHDLTGNFSLEAWVLEKVRGVTKAIISKRDVLATNKRGYHLSLNNGFPNLTWYDNAGNVILNMTSSNAIPTNIWHHIAATFDGTTAKLYADGILVVSGTTAISPTNGTEKFLIGAMYDSSTTTIPINNFNGYIDEVRVWDVALTAQQIREMMNQRIIQSSTAVKGRTIPLDITEGILWSNLKGYYPMSDGYTANDQSGNAMKINGSPKNITTNQPNTAPLPYKSIAGGDWDTPATWENNSVQYLPYSVGIDSSTKIDWNIVETNHDIYTTRDITVFGLLNKSNKLSINASSSLEVLYYLLIDVKIDLIGESQLIQSKESIFDTNSLGTIEIDQQGEGNKYRYNYWSMPVYTATETILGIPTNYTTIFASLRDGTNPGSPAPITFSNSGYDGALTTPITLSTYWMYKYANSGSGYSAWNQVRSTGKVYVGQGFTMKGPGDPGSPEQNYVFVGKPNNGPIELTVAKDYDYLVGNPYPSALDADQFLTDNNPSGTASITGTIYFWEHYGGNTHNLAGYQGGYATYSMGGGAPAASFPGLGGGSSVKGAPKQFIPVGQAFFVVGDAIDGGQIQFNNGQRVFKRESLGEALFMKSNNTKLKTENSSRVDLRPKFRIGFDAPKISHRQILLTIDERATQAVDWGFDAEIYEIFVDDMYWMLNNKKYVIQATNAIGLNSEVPLGIQLSKTGAVTVKIDALENVDEDTSVYLKDKLTGESFNMKDKPVQLNLTAGKYTDRFALTFITQKLMAEDIKAEILIPAIAQPIIEGIHVFMNNAIKELQIKNNSDEEILSIELYNYLGQTIKTWNSNFNIRTISLPVNTITGIYIVQINTKTGKTVKKISVE